MKYHRNRLFQHDLTRGVKFDYKDWRCDDYEVPNDRTDGKLYWPETYEEYARRARPEWLLEEKDDLNDEGADGSGW